MQIAPAVGRRCARFGRCARRRPDSAPTAATGPRASCASHRPRHSFGGFLSALPRQARTCGSDVSLRVSPLSILARIGSLWDLRVSSVAEARLWRLEITQVFCDGVDAPQERWGVAVTLRRRIFPPRTRLCLKVRGFLSRGNRARANTYASSLSLSLSRTHKTREDLSRGLSLATQSLPESPSNLARALSISEEALSLSHSVCLGIYTGARSAAAGGAARGVVVARGGPRGRRADGADS